MDISNGNSSKDIGRRLKACGLFESYPNAFTTSLVDIVTLYKLKPILFFPCYNSLFI